MGWDWMAVENGIPEIEVLFPFELSGDSPGSVKHSTKNGWVKGFAEPHRVLSCVITIRLIQWFRTDLI